MEVKKKLTAALNRFLDPIRERRAKLESNPSMLEEIIIEGSKVARRQAQETNHIVREAMGLSYFEAQRMAQLGGRE